MNNFGAWIRQMRDGRNITREELVQALKERGKPVAPSTLTSWEKGDVNAPIHDNQFVEVIAQIFDVSVAEVLKGAGFDLGAAYEGLDEPRRRLLEAYDSGDLERLVRLALIELDKNKGRTHRLDVDDDEGADSASDVTRAARR